MTKAHPRVCGENSGKTHLILPKQGSSPRVRGKPQTGKLDAVLHGLIPACAGKTARVIVSVMGFGAHPRVCGENGIRCLEHLGCEGSSPRVRGKPNGAQKVLDVSRLIPACAGKTNSPVNLPSHLPAHPRVCGENDHRSPYER